MLFVITSLRCHPEWVDFSHTRMVRVRVSVESNYRRVYRVRGRVKVRVRVRVMALVF